MTTVFVTKYLFSLGIKECSVNERWASLCQPLHGGIFVDWKGVTFLRKGEWHATEEEARAHAARMVAKRIDSLRRQVARLEALTF